LLFRRAARSPDLRCHRKGNTVIFGEHAVIRTAEPDDAPTLKRFYDQDIPRSATLDRRREPYRPTTDELRELLGNKELKIAGEYYAVEDQTGLVRGFCSLRSGRFEVFFGEMLLMFLDEADLATPLADETFEFVRDKAFVDRRLNKMMAHCLNGETALREFLVKQGFQSDGVSREMLFTKGRWYDNETLSLFASQIKEA
jgi:RimJ/RimL family protein N-acetyltransferase